MKAATSASVLVTGGAGFLGSHLCEKLLANGYQVTCLDNLSTGALRNVAPLLEHSRFRYLQQDVCSPLELDVNLIFNLACPASPVHYQADPLRTTRTSVLGVLNLLDLARVNGARLLQASTSEVYGDPQVHPQREDYWGHVNPVGPRACYDEGKRCAETLLTDARRSAGACTRIARIFNTYGPRMAANDGRVVSNFIVQALRNEPITVYGDGQQTRSFCFCDDLIDGLIRLMQAPEAVTGPMNLGNPQETTVLELAQRIIELTGSRSSLVRRPLPQDDPLQRCPDITLARQQLGWEPRVNLNQGLMASIRYFEAELSVAA